MHTHDLPHGYVAITDGSMIGPVSLHKLGPNYKVEQEVVIPMSVILALAAILIRRDRISKLEQMSDSELLSLPENHFASEDED